MKYLYVIKFYSRVFGYENEVCAIYSSFTVNNKFSYIMEYTESRFAVHFKEVMFLQTLGNHRGTLKHDFYTLYSA